MKMSGSKTDIFTPTMNISNALSVINETPVAAESVKRDEKQTLKPRITVPVVFKLQLIAQVKKHEIIWQDYKQKKNDVLLEDAWSKVRKALNIKKSGYCENLWKLLCHGYRNHINRNTTMHPDLSREMAFMAPQLKKSSSDVDPSDNEGGEPESPAIKKLNQKEKKVERLKSEEKGNDDQRAIISMLNILFDKLPADSLAPLKKTLVETIVEAMPEMEAAICRHATRQLATCGDINKIDWTSLDFPPEVSEAVWSYKVTKTLLTGKTTI